MNKFQTFIMVFVLFASVAMAQQPVRVPELPSSPEVDGVLDDAYRQGAQLVDFWDFSSSITQAVPAKKPMHAWLGHHDRTLYIFCECAEPEPEKIKTALDFDDGPVWTDDCLELYIDPMGDRKSYFQFVLSAAGVKADLYNGGIGWNPDYEADAKILDCSWTGEWGIPFEALGITVLEDIYADKKWTFNLYREDYVSAAYSTWVPINSTLVKTFSTPAVFADMEIVSDGEPAIYSLKDTPLRPSGKGKEEIVWQTENPLYEQLLSDEPRLIPDETGMFWVHPLGAGLVRPTAIQYGLEYSLLETANLFKDLNYHPIQQGHTLKKHIEAGEGTPYPHAKIMYMANSHYARGEGIPLSDSGFTLLYIPENAETYLRQAEEILGQYPDDIWGVFAGDEVVSHQTNVLIGGLTRYDEKLQPHVEQIDKVVKDRFGMGQYGLPESENDPEPYRWLATNSWIDEQTCILIEDLRKVVDRVAPNVKLMSDDPVAGFHAYDFARRGKVCDILTHQTYPARTPMRQECAFIAKLLFDQSGKSVWPCVHSEHYGASYTPEQTAEVYSQIFRCGADGIHYYPDDVIGSRRNLLDTHYCALGAPDRWATMKSIFEKVHHLPKVKVPEETQVGVLIEPSTIRAMSRAKSRTREEYQTCFDLLGPHAGSWFRFIHTGQLERDEVALSDYMALYLPMGKFFHPARAEQVLAFCENGGTVISTDPEFWTYSSTEAYAPVTQLDRLGLDHKGDQGEVSKIIIADNTWFPALKAADEITFPMKTKMREYDLTADWTQLAHFEEGTPAIMLKKYGDGLWIQFAFQPFEEASLDIEQLRIMFKSMQRQFGEDTDRDIWRFTFPTVKAPEPPQGTCLTGNAIHWQQNVPVRIGGDGLDEGKVSWSLKPEKVEMNEVPFDECRLMDRRKALEVKNDRRLKVALGHWSYVWDSTDELTLTLSQFRTDITLLKLWYSGRMPDASIKIRSGNDNAWHTVGEIPAGDVKTDIELFEMPLDVSESTGVRIVFPERSKGPLMLHEIEVWGK